MVFHFKIFFIYSEYHILKTTFHSKNDNSSCYILIWNIIFWIWKHHFLKVKISFLEISFVKYNISNFRIFEIWNTIFRMWFHRFLNLKCKNKNSFQKLKMIFHIRLFHSYSHIPKMISSRCKNDISHSKNDVSYSKKYMSF